MPFSTAPLTPPSANSRPCGGPENPGRSAACFGTARSPSPCSQVAAAKPAPVGEDSARPSSLISPTSEPSDETSPTDRGLTAQRPKASAIATAPQRRTGPCHSTSQAAPNVNSAIAAGIGVTTADIAPCSPAIWCATQRIHAAARPITQSAGPASPIGAKSAAIAPAPITTDIAGTVARLAKSP